MRTHTASRVALTAVALLLVVAAAAPARADSPGTSTNSPPAEKAEPEHGLGDHIELSTGFIAGRRNYAGTSFAFHDGAAGQLPGAGGLVEPLAAYPYSGVTVAGVRWDLRAVISHVRMTIGFGLPRTTFSSTQASGAYDVGGTERTVTAQSLDPYELRFGMGGEYAFGRVAIFADLLGDIHWLRTTLAVDGMQANYSATTFDFAASAGARVNLSKGFFLSAAAEVGIYGDIVWGAQLLAGFVIDV
jgi:hypothetical protein